MQNSTQKTNKIRNSLHLRSSKPHCPDEINSVAPSAQLVHLLTDIPDQPFQMKRTNSCCSLVECQIQDVIIRAVTNDVYRSRKW